MKNTKYFTLGVVVAILVITSLAFRAARSTAELDTTAGTFTLHKKIESTDPSCIQLYFYIDQYADSFNIPKRFAYGIANVETGYEGPFQWKYDHKRVSRAGAVGPMQIMPATDAFINGVKVSKASVAKLKTDIEYNVMTSMKLLHWLHDKYGNWKIAFGWYNTGKPLVNDYALKVYSYRPDWKKENNE